jgi:hypothetical protein
MIARRAAAVGPFVNLRGSRPGVLPCLPGGHSKPRQGPRDGTAVDTSQRVIGLSPSLRPTPAHKRCTAEIALNYDQGGACGAASGAPRAGLCLGRPAQRARAVPPLAAFPKGQTHQGGAAVFLGVHCPARGRRVEGGPAGRRTAIGYADPGPGGHSPGFGAYEEGRDKAVDRDNQPTIS